MKEVFKKLFGLEPMSTAEKEAVILLPFVAGFGFIMVVLAAILG